MNKSINNKSRPDFDVISNLVTSNSNVLDLGCGDGSLIKHLKEKKNIFGYGIENNLSKIDYCLKNKISVIHKDIETGMQDFGDKSFDFVILSLTLQSVKNTYNILNEMLRVGKIGIVTFPNFGFWKHRLQIMLGAMPVSVEMPYQWFNTPNIHLCTINDFEIFCYENEVQIEEKFVFGSSGKSIKHFSNFFGLRALYILKKEIY